MRPMPRTPILPRYTLNRNTPTVGMNGIRASQHDAEAAQRMPNQRIGLQPYQLSSISAFQESYLKRNYCNSYAQLFKDSSTIHKPQLQLNEYKAIQESQGPTNQGTKNSPILVSEDSTELLGSLYQKIQKCKEECLLDVMKIQNHYVSQMPQSESASQKVPENIFKIVFKIQDSIELLHLQRGSKEHKVDQNVDKRIEEIYEFTSYMKNKHPMLFARTGEESNSDHGERQTAPSAVRDQNHTHQKQDILQQEDAAGLDAENNVVSPLNPAKTDAENHPIDPLVDVNQSKNLHGEEVSQASPVDRLVKAVKEASPESLMAAAQDILAVTSAADRIYKVPAYRDGQTYTLADLAAWTNYKLHTKNVPSQRMKRNFNVVSVHKCYDGDALFDSPQASLEKAKRQKVEENKTLMTEIEFLKGKLVETQIVIEKPDAGSPTPEGDGEIKLSCTFSAASHKARNDLSHLFPVRMQLKIPRDYPQSRPTILPCRHPNCGVMCAVLQRAYERWSSQRREITSVKEIVQRWNAFARELYADISLGTSRRNRGTELATWEKNSA